MQRRASSCSQLWLRLWRNCDVTATRNEHVHFSARLQPVTMHESVSVWAWSTSCGVIVYCYFHVFQLINKDNLLIADIFLFNYACDKILTSLDDLTCWRRGVVVSGVRQWTKLTHVGPGYNWDGWPSSGGYTISGCNQPTRSTQPPGSLNRVPASAGAKAGMSPLPGGRCDPMWHVSSRSGEASCELLYSVYLYLRQVLSQSQHVVRLSQLTRSSQSHRSCITVIIVNKL